MINTRYGGIYIDVQLTIVPSPNARKAPDKEVRVIIGSSLVIYSFTGPLSEQGEVWERMHTFLTHHELQENRHINQSDSSLRIFMLPHAPLEQVAPARAGLKPGEDFT